MSRALVLCGRFIISGLLAVKVAFLVREIPTNWDRDVPLGIYVPISVRMGAVFLLIAAIAACLSNWREALRVVGMVFVLCGLLPLTITALSRLVSTHIDGDDDFANDFIRPAVWYVAWICVGLILFSLGYLSQRRTASS